MYISISLHQLQGLIYPDYPMGFGMEIASDVAYPCPHDEIVLPDFELDIEGCQKNDIAAMTLEQFHLIAQAVGLPVFVPPPLKD